MIKYGTDCADRDMGDFAMELSYWETVSAMMLFDAELDGLTDLAKRCIAPEGRNIGRIDG